MENLGLTSSLRKSYSNEPKKTLSFLTVDNFNEDHSDSDLTSNVDKKSKTEKSVHFADEESLTDNDSSYAETSQDIITWIPSEHLYSGNTFIDESSDESENTLSSDRNLSCEQAASVPTVASYGSNTFISLESDDTNTDTEQLYSYTDSFLSPEGLSSQSLTTSYKSWRDVTEIVKDIEELEESEFVTRADSLELEQQENDDTDVSESVLNEVTEAAHQNFISYALQTLRMKQLQSPRSFSTDSVLSDNYVKPSSLIGVGSKEEREFCSRMIQRCKKQSGIKSTSPSVSASPHPLYEKVDELKNQPMEYYGLNSALVQRLKLDNFQAALEKKSDELDHEIAASEHFVNDENQSMAWNQFISQACARVRRENIDNAIQAHLLKMHPVLQFAEFVKGLPSLDLNAREILYEYKRQLNQRKETDELLLSKSTV